MRNLKLAAPLYFISMLFFPSATWMFFFIQHLNFSQIASIMGIGALLSVIFEIPTGVFADVVGRKWAVALSYALFAIAMIATTLATSYSMFLIITIINCLVNALYSGSMEALLYDTLKEQGKEKEFDHWTSKMESLTWIGLFVSTVMGGYMYMVNPKFPYYAQACVMAVGTVLSLMLVEPKLDSIKYEIRDLWKQNLSGFKELFSKPKIRYLTLIFMAVGLGYYIGSDILDISQARQYGLNAEKVGWIFAIGYLISALTSHYYTKLQKAAGEMKLFWMSVITLVISFVAAKFVGVLTGMGMVMLRKASVTTFRNSRSILINREITSSSRATTLSTLTLLTEIPYALTAVEIGAYIDRTSPNQFAFVLGLIILSILVLIQLLHYRTK